MLNAKLLSIALAVMYYSQSFGQPVTIKTILDATKTCSTPAQFTDYVKAFGFCFREKREMPTFTYYTHFSCGSDDIGLKGVRINFAVSNDSSLNSSFLTRNAEMVTGFMEELKAYQFNEIQQEGGEPRTNAKWYASPEFPGIHILWEYNVDDNDRKVWHIGFVWNMPEN